MLVQYGSMFPNHPLSQLRGIMKQIEQNMEFHPDLKEVKKFEK
jgi:hypothetical protein